MKNKLILIEQGLRKCPNCKHYGLESMLLLMPGKLDKEEGFECNFCHSKYVEK